MFFNVHNLVANCNSAVISEHISDNIMLNIYINIIVSVERLNN